jgi:hypothetical protein
MRAAVRSRFARGTASGLAARGSVTFSISNARAELGSYWVRAVDARGNADIFRVRNILATAVANWARA